MMGRRWLVKVTVVACALTSAIAIHALAATTPAPFDPRNDPEDSSTTRPSSIEQMAPGAALKEQARTGNPLWGVLLRSLSSTRERPIFLQSRRPPAPAVAATVMEPVKQANPVEPERPALSLVGVVTGSGDGFAVFINDSTRDIVRLKTGEGYEGWILRSVQVRQAVLEKNRQTAIFQLPPPTGDQK
jgi:hypothetical protein